ncbi:hypothetical protein FB451DRAFT_1279844 [Mycena latifolia]|nr:hypothetical protein FB451DRAFT_1279844 [Mycena latifolia]
MLGDTLGRAMGAPARPNSSVKLRLDLNLDIEVTIKAKIHGDITLSLLSFGIGKLQVKLHCGPDNQIPLPLLIAQDFFFVLYQRIP